MAESSEEGVPVWVKAVVAILFLMFVSTIAVYFVHFGKLGSLGTQGEFGQFGDYVGGLLNPVFSFASVMILLWSLRAQAGQLRASNRALEQAEILHREQLDIQRRESIRTQLKADADVYVDACELLLGKPIFKVETESYPGGITISLNDMFKNPEFFGEARVGELLAAMPKLAEGDGAVSLHVHVHVLRAKLAFAVTSVCNLIQYLDVHVLRRSWEMRLHTLITDVKCVGVITDEEAEEFKVTLIGALSVQQQTQSVSS